MGLTVKEVAHRLGVSVGTVRRWTDQGELKCFRTPGGQRRFTEGELGRFIGVADAREQQGHDQGREESDAA